MVAEEKLPKYQDLLCPHAQQDLKWRRGIYTLDVTNPLHKEGGGARNLRFVIVTKNKDVVLTLTLLQPEDLWDFLFTVSKVLGNDDKQQDNGAFTFTYGDRTVLATLVKVDGKEQYPDKTIIHFS